MWWTKIRPFKVDLIIHLATPHNPHNKDSTGEMNPREIYEQIRLLTWTTIQKIIFFLFHNFFLCILYFKNDFKLDFHDLPFENIVERPPCTLQRQPLKAAENHHTAKEETDIKANHAILVHIEPIQPVHVHTPVPRKVPDRYKPLVLPPVLNPLAKNHPDYLPRFDGENGITAQKHIEAFKDYLNIFEVEEEDVSIRLFSLSLQREVRTWFKALLEASISNL